MKVEASYDSNKKDFQVNIRMTFDKKEQVKEEARKLGMTMSEYINYLLDNRSIVVIDGREEILDTINDLAETVKNCVKNPFNLKKEEPKRELIEAPFTYIFPED